MYKKLIVGLIMTMSPFASGMIVLNKDIARNQIQKWLTFQEISRLKQLSKYCNALYDIESNCLHLQDEKCSTYACNQCAKNYYQCTKMLVYFALKHHELKCNKLKDNEHALKHNKQMFQHLWVHHCNIRKSNVDEVAGKNKKNVETMIKGEKPEITIKDAMHCYRKNYGRLKDTHRHMCRSVTKAISSGNVGLANTVLSGSGLSLFDICKDDITLDCAFAQACELNNVDLIKNICGGCVDDRSFGYVIYYVDNQVLFDLIDKDILPADSATKDGKKSVLHYAAEYGFENVVRIALEKSAYVNCRDCFDKTPLHYAVQKEHLDVVRELLKSPDVDVRCKDNKGKMPVDYNVPELKHLLHIPKRTYERNVIAKKLKNHQDQHQVSGYSRAKVHSNGYQKLS